MIKITRYFYDDITLEHLRYTIQQSWTYKDHTVTMLLDSEDPNWDTAESDHVWTYMILRPDKTAYLQEGKLFADHYSVAKDAERHINAWAKREE